MRFAFTDDQITLRDGVRELLKGACPPAVVRETWEAGGVLPAALTGALAESGVAAVLVPEDFDGLGMTASELAPLIEEAGYAAVPGLLLETAAVAAPVLARVGGVPAERWLPGIASGELSVALGLAGTALVAGADQASLLLLEREGHLYATTRDRVSLTPEQSADHTRRLFQVDYTPDPDDLLGGPELTALALDAAAIASAAFLNGLARRMLDMSVDYVKVREQFGRPVGSFQAVKHHLADALMHLEFARPAVWRAAWTLSTGGERALQASMAKARASDAADLAGRKALQVHGAIGYTTECDLHHWLKRSWALRRAFGGAAWHRARVAEHLLT